MANRMPPRDLLSADCLSSAVTNFHKIYAMPLKQLELSKNFNERVLDKCFRHLGFCTDIRKMGGSYDDVKVVKSEAEDDFEFDVMFVLKIPEECHLEIVEIPGRHGYAMLTVANGSRGTPDYYRSAGYTFFAGCLTFENDMLIVDAEKTTAAFFEELHRWMNTKPVLGYNLRPKQRGNAIQMDVIPKQKGKNSISYSVDIAPTIEILDGDCVNRYVHAVKPEKRRTPHSITWRLLSDSEENASDPMQFARNIFQSAIDGLDKQLSEYCASCKGICNCKGSCFIPEAARTQKPLPNDYILKLQAALVARASTHRLTLVNHQELNSSRSKRLVAINNFFENELEVMPVLEQPGYAWLKLREEHVHVHVPSLRSPLGSGLKLCYLPDGKYLDHKAASDMLVVELKDIANDVFIDEDTVVRSDGPIVRIEVYSKEINTWMKYFMDIFVAAYVAGNIYIGLPHDYDDANGTKAWRRSYSSEEDTEMEQAPDGLKVIFRVLRALRNEVCGLAQLTSYHFKTLLLNMHQLNLVNWKDNIGKILISVLEHLKICLSEKKLQTRYSPEINLFENLTNDCSVNMKNRLDELLRNRWKMFKTLNIPTEETTRDVFKEHFTMMVEQFPESRLSCGCFENYYHPEIDKQLFGYNHETFIRKPVYDDISVYRVCKHEFQGLTNCSAMMFIHSKNNLRVCHYTPRVVRLERCNSTVSTSLLQTVPHSSCLADTRKTAEYTKQQIENLIENSSFLRQGACLRVHLEGSNIILKSKYKVILKILPGHEVDQGFFVAMPGVGDTSTWIRIPFTPASNKFWKAFKNVEKDL